MTVAFVNENMRCLLSNHSSHHMFPLALFIVYLLLENSSVGIEFFLEFFNKFCLFGIILFVVH
jgi:hypothetical protein